MLAGCLPVVRQMPSASFVGWIEDFGQTFTPTQPPAGVVSPEAVVLKLRAEGFPPFAAGARMAPPIYGVVTCIEAARCRDQGLTAPCESLAVWVVDYPDTSGANGGTAWAMLEALTGEFISGDGPPEP